MKNIKTKSIIRLIINQQTTSSQLTYQIMSFKRLTIDQYGDPLTVLKLEQVDKIPVPADDEIVINMIASPIHPSDLAFVQARYVAFGMTRPVPPVSPGSEGVGRIHAVGKDVTEFAIGQRVAFYNDKNAWSEYLVLKRPFFSVVPVPDILPDTIAGQAFVNPLTAYAMLEDINAKPNEWILQTAAGSVLGQMIIQLAKLRGLQLINVVRRAVQAGELKSRFGEDIHVLVFDGTNETEFARQIKELTNGKGVNYLLDPVGGSTTQVTLNTLALNGRAIFYGLISGEAELKISFYDILMHNIRIEGFRVAAWLFKHSQEERQRMLTDLIGLLASKKLVPLLEDVMPIEDFKNAIIKSVTPGKVGKVFIAPHPEQVSRHNIWTVNQKYY